MFQQHTQQFLGGATPAPRPRRCRVVPFTANSTAGSKATCTAQHSSRQQATTWGPRTTSDSQQQGSPVSASLAAVAAAAALLWPAQAAHALAEAQLQEIKQTIDRDFQEGQYYVTGNLTTALYAPDCRFKDPTTDVKGVEPYTRAVAALFDPAVSKVDLISSEVSGPNSITLRWRLEGKLKIGNLAIKPYTGTTVYTVDESSRKITAHTETWDISAVDAFVSTLLPGFGAPPAPPVSK